MYLAAQDAFEEIIFNKLLPDAELFAIQPFLKKIPIRCSLQDNSDSLLA